MMQLHRRYWFGAVFFVVLAALLFMNPEKAAAAACTPPATDYGTVSNLSTTIDEAGTYRIWTRMAAANASSNTYLLEIDGNTCFTVGGSTVPVYSSGTTTHFASNSTNWINRTSGGATVSMTLSTGTHTIKLIGNAAGVVVDRLIFTTSTTCTPSGTGGNCADASGPQMTNITAGSITHQSASVSWATDETSDTQVQYGTTTSYGSTTTLVTTMVTSHTVNLSGLSPGTLYHYRVLSRDVAGNLTTSTDRTFTTSSTPSYISEDLNQDGTVNILDISILITNYGRSGAGLGRSDINGDNTVNILDLTMLIGRYGQ